MSKLGKILLFVAGIMMVLFVFTRAYFNEWLNLNWVTLGLALVLTLAEFYVDRHFWKDFLTVKTTKQGMSMGALIFLVVIGIVAINFIAAKKYRTFDFSAAKKNSLSEQSIQLVKTLDSELQVIYFYKKGAQGVDEARRAFGDLIRKYQDYTTSIKLEFIEINARPDLTKQYEINQGTQVVVLDYKGRTSRIEKIDEQELTSAIVKVTRAKDKIVYMLTGHGELPLEFRQDGQSMAYIKELLTKNRYQVQPLNLVKSPKVPEDADMLFVVGPKGALLEPEIKAIEAYMKNGGNAVFALEPKIQTGLEKLTEQMGIKTKGSFVALKIVDPSSGRPLISAGVAGTVFTPGQPITKPFGQDQFTLFFLPQGLEKATAPGSIKTEDLIKTDNNWKAFTDEKFTQQVGEGPFTLAMTAKGKLPGADEKSGEFTLVVFGDSDFMNDQLVTKNLNRDLVLNTAAYLAKDDNMISISPKEVGITDVSKFSKEKFVVLLFCLIIPLPIALFVSSGVVWYRRRYS